MTTKIGFFDSGIGGVTVLKECIKLNPNFEYIYYSDSKNNPYGDKDIEELNIITDNITNKLINEGCKIIVIACNTASCECVSMLREKYKDISFIAIEPAIKIASDLNSNGCLIMATKGTIDSDKFKLLFDKYHKDNYYLLPCVGLANMIENNEIEELSIYLKEHLLPYKDKVSSVVLGCTHYPLIKKEISDVLGKVSFYDGSIGVAKRLNSVIKENNYIGNKNIITFYDSSNDENKEKRFYEILEK